MDATTQTITPAQAKKTMTEAEKLEHKKELNRMRAKRYYESHKEQTTARVLRHYYKKMAEAIENGERVARGRGRPRKNVEDKVKNLMEQEKLAIQRDLESRERIRAHIMNRVVA